MAPPPTLPRADGQISDLIELIKNATNIIESHYLNSSRPSIPSLDSLISHPLDSVSSPPQLRDAVQLLEGACAQLCATLARPSHTILNFYEPTCLSVVTTFKVPDILQEQPSGMRIEDIGKKAGVNHEKLGRIMRLLATKHIFREVATDCFANNRLSLQLLSSNPLASLVSHLTDDNYKATSMLTEVLADPEWGDSQAFERSSWNMLTGFEGSMYQYFEGATSERAKQGARFAIGMRGWNDATEGQAVLTDFPWNRYPPGTTINDVGGGIGSMAMELIKIYPNLQLKLQDLPSRIDQAETEVWPKLLPSAIAEKRIEFKAINFIVDSPIEGCDVYYLKGIIHNWPDKECIQILRNIRAVLKPSARVLLRAWSVCRVSVHTYQKWVYNPDDYVLQHANRNQTSNSAFTEAPEPMLPNCGVGQIRPYNLDLCVMVLLNSKERTLEELIDIASKADLQFVKLWCTGETGVVEFQPA
ncbi:hypothetical protein C0995_012649 [Termitomyces sp. Mi166|nr:hypothetical protein C0995_012649 [Termitomyces sp. Mi166\